MTSEAERMRAIADKAIAQSEADKQAEYDELVAKARADADNTSIESRYWPQWKAEIEAAARKGETRADIVLGRTGGKDHYTSTFLDSIGKKATTFLLTLGFNATVEDRHHPPYQDDWDTGATYWLRITF